MPHSRWQRNCNDLHHGTTASPQLNFAVVLQGPLVERVRGTAAAIWRRAHLGQTWRGELLIIAQAAAPLDEARRVWRGLRSAPAGAADAQAEEGPTPSACREGTQALAANA